MSNTLIAACSFAIIYGCNRAVSAGQLNYWLGAAVIMAAAYLAARVLTRRRERANER
jgi:hypothetical protein